MSRPRFTPTAEQRKLVANLSGINCTQEEIIECIPWGNPGDKPIDQKTLRKHFGPELTRGKALAHMRVKKKIADMIDQGSIAMTIFYAKVHFGWKETVAVEQSGPNGTPLAPLASVVCYLPAKDALPDDMVHVATPPAGQHKAALPPWQEPPRPAAPPAPPEPTTAGSVRPSGYMYPGAADPRR